MRQDSEFPEQINLDVVRSSAAAACEEIAVALLGPPSTQDRREMRWGHKGSLALDISRKRGLWYDHEHGEGGDIIDLVERELRVSFVDAIKWLAGQTGNGHWTHHCVSPAQPDEQRVNYARRLWSEARPIAGGPGEAYFGGRGLRLPEPTRLRLRYHGAKDAVIAPFRNFVDREVTGVQLLFADRPKKSHGVLRGAAVMLLPGSGTLTVAEGVATALGAVTKAVTHGAVWALGGTAGLARLPVIDGYDSLVICADNDHPGRAAAQQAKETWQEAGRCVLVRYPKRWGDDWADGN